MPSGRTHDRITLWGLPFITGLTFGSTGSGNVTLIVAGAYLFSGLMFGPDLDLYSIQYKRWGYLRWIWIPYQKALRHRSLLSHGLIIGTTVRILYLAIWLSVLGIFCLGIAQLVWDVGWNWGLEPGMSVISAVCQFRAGPTISASSCRTKTLTIQNWTDIARLSGWQNKFCGLSIIWIFRDI